MTNLKEWMNAQWQAKGVKCANHGTAWLGDDVHSIHARAGTARNYKSKEQKAYEARFGLYNKKLVPIILAEATVERVAADIDLYDERGVYKSTKKGTLSHYTWSKQAPVQNPVETVTAVPRKRVSKAKLDRAAAILEQVPADELAGFLARFGLSMSLAASIASLDNIEMISRQFLRATL